MSLSEGNSEPQGSPWGSSSDWLMPLRITRGGPFGSSKLVQLLNHPGAPARGIQLARLLCRHNDWNSHSGRRRFPVSLARWLGVHNAGWLIVGHGHPMPGSSAAVYGRSAPTSSGSSAAPQGVRGSRLTARSPGKRFIANVRCSGSVGGTGGLSYVFCLGPRFCPIDSRLS